MVKCGGRAREALCTSASVMIPVNLLAVISTQLCYGFLMGSLALTTSGFRSLIVDIPGRRNIKFFRLEGVTTAKVYTSSSESL